MPVYVAVCGAGEASGEVAAQAEEVGRLLARSGAVVVCGGLGGVMEAAARGAETEGGTSLGILPVDSSNAIFGFGSGDVIDLANVAYASGASVTITVFV